MSDDSFANPQGIRRRRLLELTATTGAVAIAGCMGGGNDDDENEIRFVNAASTIEPNTAQFNPYNPTGFNEVEAPQFFDFLGVFSPEEGEFKGLLADEWEFDEGILRITLREQTWTNGDQLTSEDVRTTLMIENLFDNPVWELIEEVDTPDDRTIELILSNDGDINQDYLLYYLFDPNLPIATPVSIYGEYVDRYEEADTEEEIESIQTDLSQLEQTEVFAGPFALESRHGSRYIADTVEDHPAGSQLNFDGFEYYRVSDSGEGDTAVQSGDADVHNFGGEEEEIEALPDNVKVTQFAWYTGVGYSFNYERDIFTYPEFRKAFAHLCNRTNSTRNVGTLAETPFEVPHGMVGEFIDVPQEFIGDQWSNFEPYGYDSRNQDEAADLLENAGFSREDGEWYKPNGNPIEEIEITGPAGWSWMRMVETDVEALNDFGIPATTNGADSSVMMGDLWSQGDFDIITNEVGGFQQYPAGMFSKLFASEIGAVFDNPDGNMPEEFDIPMPVGDPNGDMESFNIVDKMAELASESNEEAANEIITEIAWFVNQAVPVLPVFDRMGLKIWNTDRFNIPDEDHPLMQIVYPEQMLTNFPDESDFGARD